MFIWCCCIVPFNKNFAYFNVIFHKIHILIFDSTGSNICYLEDILDVSVGAKQNKQINNDPTNYQPKQKGSLFSCNQCDKVYPFLSLLKIHLGSHTKPFQCSLCLKSFTRQGDLKRHWRLHSGERPYKCSECKYTATNCSTLKFHLAKKHPNNWCVAYSSYDKKNLLSISFHQGCGVRNQWTRCETWLDLRYWSLVQS